MRKKQKTTYSKRRFLFAFLCVMGLFAAVRHIFSINAPLHVKENTAQATVEKKTAEKATEEVAPATTEQGSPPAAEEKEAADAAFADPQLAKATDPQQTEAAAPPASQASSVWSYVDCFPDIQDVQIEAAQQHGVTPVKSRAEADLMVQSRRLVNICHSPYYTVDDLTHSIPYLVPRAQRLLDDIGLSLLDSCLSKGLPPCLPIVTSVMRTTDDVERLQRGNKNATTNSCHCYGTTIDIAYSRFMPVTGQHCGSDGLLRWDDSMKRALAEVLHDLRTQGRCYVKYEIKQGCFHITCR